MNRKKIAMQKLLTANNPQQMLFAEELTTTTPLNPSNSTRQGLEHKFKNLIHEELKLGSVDSYEGNKIVVICPSLCHYEEFSAIEYAILRKLIENK
jgi:predicted glycosyltransferase involved in capsule biosynthesis